MDMKEMVALVAGVACLLSADAMQPSSDEAKASWLEEDISPEIGTCVAGYGVHDVSVEKLDPILASMLAVEYEGRRCALVSLDLLGIDAPVLREMRRGVASILDVPEAYVMITCTHTHGGPHARMLNEGEARMKLHYTLDGDPPAGLNVPYLKELRAKLYAMAKKIKDGPWRTVRIGFHSSQVDMNSNRRFTTADNCASFVAHRRLLQKIATGIADKEFGIVALFEVTNCAPLYVIGNYAAHPLAAHGPGTGGLRISSDFPGYFRRYVKSETGADAMFVQGACGDLIPKDDELGRNAAQRIGESLAEAAMASVIDIQRNSGRYIFSKPAISAEIRSMRTRILERHRKHFDDVALGLDIQCLSIGEVAFVGVPGEIVNEVGLEMKWHSPFKRTFIAYCATDYMGYISPASFLAAGGYEPQSQRFPSRDVLRLVSLAADTLSCLHEESFPTVGGGEDRYPDNLELPIVNLPGGLKWSKRSTPNK